MSTVRTACQRWLAPIGTFVTSQRICYDAFHVLEIVMTLGAKDGQGPPVCAQTPDDWTLGEKRAHSSAEGANFLVRSWFGQTEQACLRVTRRLGMAGKLATRAVMFAVAQVGVWKRKVATPSFFSC